MQVRQNARLMGMKATGYGRRESYAHQPMDALSGADALVVVTEWKAYRSPNITRLKAQMKQPVVFDGRNLYEPLTMREAGLSYFGVGRNSH